MFLRMKFELKSSKGERWGLRAPRPAPGDFAPWTRFSRRYLVEIAQETPRAALGTEYSKLSGTMKIGEIGRGKSRLP